MITYCKQLQTVVTREECLLCPQFPGNPREPGIYQCTPVWSDDFTEVLWDGIIDITEGSKREVL